MIPNGERTDDGIMELSSVHYTEPGRALRARLRIQMASCSGQTVHMIVNFVAVVIASSEAFLVCRRTKGHQSSDVRRVDMHDGD